MGTERAGPGGQELVGSVTAPEELWAVAPAVGTGGCSGGRGPPLPTGPGPSLSSQPPEPRGQAWILGSLSSDSGHGPHTLLEPHPHTPQGLSDPEPS